MVVPMRKGTFITVIYTSANGSQGVHEMDWMKLYGVAHVSRPALCLSKRILLLCDEMGCVFLS